MRKMNDREMNVMAFINIVNAAMDWELPIKGVKINNMVKYKGMCISNGWEIHILISDYNHKTERDFWHTVLHEMIHAYLLYNDYPHRIAAGHGKVFKRYAKSLAAVSKGLYSAKRIIHAID
jgi:hypothetical protein